MKKFPEWILPLAFMLIALLFHFEPIFAQQKTIQHSDNQELIRCANDYFHAKMMNNNASYKKKHEALEQIIYQEVTALKKEENEKNIATCTNSSNILTIPIVVFIVHKSGETNPLSGSSNPTDAQILQGIDDLNNAFRNIGSYVGNGHGANDNANPDATLLASVDIEIEFCLAKRDINGNPTSGIHRIEDTSTNQEYTNLDIDTGIPAMKAYVESNLSATGLFPSSDYAGVWLTNSLCSNNTCDISGIASPSLGVINQANLWGTSSDNSVAHIHGFGHYLSLNHTYLGGCVNNDCLSDGDKVCDTPPENDSTAPYAACGTAENTCTTDTDSGSFTVDQDDMYENYMDHSNNDCVNTFTQGQKDRMRASLLSRTSLLNSKACIDPNMEEAGISKIVVPAELVCATTFSPVLEIENNGNTVLNSLSFDVQIDGGATTNVTVTTSIAVGSTTNVTLDPISFTGTGSHEINAVLTAINGGFVDTYIQNNSICKSFIYNTSVNTLDYCEDIESGDLNDFVLAPFSNVNNTFEAWSNTSCVVDNGNTAIKINTWDNRTIINNTEKAQLYLSVLNLEDYENPTLVFDRAHKQASSSTVTGLNISVSEDCGATFITQYDAFGTDLSTINGFETSEAWAPENCNEWMSTSIDLEDFAGCTELMIRFEIDTRNPSNFSAPMIGQNLYLDNICVNGTPCVTLNNTTTSPGTITSCTTPTETSLTVDNKGDKITDDTKEVVGWWITKGSPINTTVTDKASLQDEITNANIGGDLEADANIIYEANATTGTYPLSINCQDLERDVDYYATPFVAQREMGVTPFPTVNNYTSCTFGDPVSFKCDCDPFPPNLVCQSAGTVDVTCTTVTISDFIVQNTGELDAAASEVGYYLSTDQTFTTTDYLIGTSDVGLLSSMATETETFSVDVSTISPSIPNGTYYIGMLIDYDNQVAEGDETDNDDCSFTTQVTIADAFSTPMVAVTPEQCEGEDGTAMVSFTGGTAPFMIHWSTGTSMNNTLTALSAGSYDVSITDANACVSPLEDFNIVNENSSFTLTDITTNLKCNNDLTGAINLTASGTTGVVSYEWSFDNRTTEDLFGLAAGVYNVTVSDETTCEETRSFTITEPDPLTLSETITDASFCKENDGEIVVVIEGGTPNYIQNWSVNTADGSSTAENLEAGTYTLTVTDENDCKIDASYTVDAITVPSITVTPSPEKCEGGDGSATITIIDGNNQDYTVYWDINGTITSGVNMTTIENLSAGTYAVHIDIPNETGCKSASQSFTITNDETGIILTSLETSPSCNGASDGMIDLMATNTTGVVTYQWSANANDAITEDISGLIAGTYSVTVEDATACQTIQSFTVTEPMPLSFAANITDASLCKVDDGQIEVTVTGGTTNYTYDWSEDSADGSNIASDLEAGSYTLMVTDNNGCTLTESYDVTVAMPPSVSVSTVDATCGNADGGASLVINNSSNQSYTVYWSNGTNGLNETTIGGLAAGGYSVYVELANEIGCQSSTAYFTVSNSNSGFIVEGSKEDITCNGLTDGTIDAMVTGTATGATYSWEDNNNITALERTDLAAGTYTLSVTDDNNCVEAAQFTITEPNAIVGNFTNIIEPRCTPDNNGSFDVSVTGGINAADGLYDFEWNMGGTNERAISQTLSNLSSGNYELTLTDDNDCMAVATYQLACDNTLPVNLILFDVKLQKSGHALLEWKVSEEINFAHYIIQRSLDATNWKDIGLQNATSQTTYSFIDREVLTLFNKNRQVYYRLIMVNLDGSEMTSPIRNIYDNTVATQLSLFPNPTAGSVTIAGNFPQTTDLIVSVINVNGKEVLLQSHHSIEQQITLDLSNLAAGIYWLKIQAPEEAWIKKVVRH